MGWSLLSLEKIRTHLKNVFWPPAFGGIGSSFQILDIQQYAFGLRPTKIIGLGGKSPHSEETRPRRDLEPKSYF
jgi:hypothetical protein